MTVATGAVDHSSNLIPKIWGKALLIAFFARTCLSLVSNRDYEGQIKKHGDKVTLVDPGEITIREYIKKQKLILTEPESDSMEMEINKGFYYNHPLNVVDKIQSMYNHAQRWANDASKKMQIQIEKKVFGDVYTDVAAANAGNTAGAESASFVLGATGTPLALTKSNIVDTLVDCGTVLDEQNIPDDGRYMVLPSWATGLIKKSELKEASLTGDPKSLLRTGLIGRVDRFNIFSCNNLSSVTDTGHKVFNSLFGHTSALTFASQIDIAEEVDNQEDFGRIARGLQIFGYKLRYPVAAGHLYAYKG